MICPACNTQNTHQGADRCVQCGSDLNVHRKLSELRTGMQMQNEDLKEAKATKSFNILMIMQIILSSLFLVCTVFSMFVGMQFLAFLKRAELQNNFRSTHFEIGYEQLQQMNSIIQKELDLIIDQRRENQALQAKVAELTKPTETSDHTEDPTTLSSAREEN